MRDVEPIPGEESAYECYDCSAITVARSNPIECPECGAGLRNRRTPLE